MPNSYRISHITDLLQVPKERRAQCVVELLATIERSVGAAKILDQACPVPTKWEVAALTWVDDGETNLEVLANGESVWTGKIEEPRAR